MSKQSKLAAETKKAEIIVAKIQSAGSSQAKKAALKELQNFLSK